MPWFRNHYRCPNCSETWCDEWSAMCDDDCPKCGARHISPYKSDDETPDVIALLKDLAETYRRINGTGENFSCEGKLGLFLEHEDAVFGALKSAEGKLEGADDE